MQTKKITGVLFDLDGTLIDTALDMVAALNKQLELHHKQAIPYEEARNYVSQGAVALIEYGFKEDFTEAQINELRKEYLAIYATLSSHKSALFPNMDKVLDYIEKHNMPWGIVTNKPEDLAVDLLKALKLYGRLATFYGGDTLSKKKPDPDQLLAACQDIQMPTEQILYIGDDQRDIIAAKAANMPNAVVNYGYINGPIPPVAWDADYYFDDAIDIIDLLETTRTQ